MWPVSPIIIKEVIMLSLPEGTANGVKNFIDWFLVKLKKDQVTTILLILLLVSASINYGCITKYNQDIVNCQDKVDEMNRNCQTRLDTCNERHSRALMEQIRRSALEKEKSEAYKRETDQLMLDYQKLYINKYKN